MLFRRITRISRTSGATNSNSLKKPSTYHSKQMVPLTVATIRSGGSSFSCFRQYAKDVTSSTSAFRGEIEPSPSQSSCNSLIRSSSSMIVSQSLRGRMPQKASSDGEAARDVGAGIVVNAAALFLRSSVADIFTSTCGKYLDSLPNKMHLRSSCVLVQVQPSPLQMWMRLPVQSRSREANREHRLPIAPLAH